MMIIAIKSKERRDVATRDAKGAFVHSKEKNFTVAKFFDEQSEIMCDTVMNYKNTFLMRERERSYV